MSSIHLPSYIRHGGLLQSIAEQGLYDLVLMEVLPDAALLKELPAALTVKEMKYLGFGLAGEVKAYCEQFARVCVIIDSIPLLYLTPFLEHYTGDRTCTVINLGAGISGLLHKNAAELNDIVYTQVFEIPTKEPYDIVHFFSLLAHTGLQYIRVPLQEYASSLFGDELTIIDKHILDLTVHDLSGGNTTVLCCPSRLAETISHAQQMQEEGTEYDLFCFTDYNFGLSKALQGSIRSSESLILFVDADETALLQRIKALLFDTGLFETEIVCITPDVSTVTTNQEERIYEQAGLIMKV